MGGERNKRDVFFIYYIQDPLRSAELSQCDCKYHFYGIKLGIESPDRFVSSLILHVSHHVCVRASESVFEAGRSNVPRSRCVRQCQSGSCEF